jgi:hypothetical protein
MALMDSVILPPCLENDSFGFDRSLVQSGKEVLKDLSCPTSQLCLQGIEWDGWTVLPLIVANCSALPNISEPASCDLGI